MNETKENSSLPEGWKWVKLREVCTKMSNGANAKQSDEKIGLAISRIETIWNEAIDWYRVKYIQENEKEFIEKYALKENDILFSHINSDIHLGKTAIYKNQTQILIHGINLLLIRLNENAVADFFNYQFKYKRKRGEFSGIAQKSVNQSSINQPKLKNVDFVLPPKPIQQAIVSKIEQLFSELDKSIETLRLAQQQLKTYRQAVLKWAFEGKLTEEWRNENGLSVRIKSGSHKNVQMIPSGFEPEMIAAEPVADYNIANNELPKSWNWVKFKELGVWKGGGTPSKNNKSFWEGGTILWVSPKDMKSRRITDTIDKITEEAIQHSSTKLIDKDSLLFVVRSGILRRTLPVSITSSVVTVNQDIQAFTPKDDLPYYLYWFTQASNENIRKDCSKDGTTVESIESSLLKNYLIPICSIKEQQKIVDEIENRLSVADKMEESITQSLQQAEALRQSILKKAFEGKLL